MKRRMLCCAFLGVSILAVSPVGAVGDKAKKRECDTSSFGTNFCATHYNVAIAGIKLGDPVSKARRILGPPMRRREGPPINCPFEGALPERNVPTMVNRYKDGLTVRFERLSHSSNICLNRHLNRQKTVSEIVTTSPDDRFANGIHVGSSLRATKRAFRRRHISCTYGKSYQPKATGECSLPVKIPRWARRDRAIAGLLFDVEHRRVVKIRLLLYKHYS